MTSDVFDTRNNSERILQLFAFREYYLILNPPAKELWKCSPK